MNQPASFAVQLNGARGVIDARVHTPSGAVEECYVSELDSGEPTPPLPLLPGRGLLGRRRKDKGSPTTLCPTDKHTIRFIPHENGVHSIDVKFNGAHIPGSPFKIRVGEQSQAGDPGLVSAYGPGLEGGTTGECLGLGRMGEYWGALFPYCPAAEAGAALSPHAGLLWGARGRAHPSSGPQALPSHNCATSGPQAFHPSSSSTP